MLRRFLPCLVLFALALPAYSQDYDKALQPGDVKIPVSWRIRNRASNCVWCAAETICRQAGIEEFDDIVSRAVAEGWHGASMRNVEKAFVKAGLTYQRRDPGMGRNYDIFYNAVKEGVGCYFQVPGHAMVLVGIDDNHVRIIDNNGPPVVKSMTRGEFDQAWEGYACFPFRRRPCPSPSTPFPSLKPVKPADNVGPVVEPTKPPAEPVKPAVDPNAALLTAIDGLNKKIDAIQLTPGPMGPPGPMGKSGVDGSNGRPGKDVDPATVATLQAALQDAKAQIKLLQNARYTVFLYDENGVVKQTAEFGIGQPLGLKLVPVVTAPVVPVQK